MEPPAGETTESILTLFQRTTGPLWEKLCQIELSTEQRRALGGHLFPEAIAYVHATAEGLREHPELFSHIPVSHEELAKDQKAALDLLFVHRGLSLLAQLAYDAYLAKQASVIQNSKRVLRMIRAEGDALSASNTHRREYERRVLWTSSAQKILSERKFKRKHRSSKKKSHPL